MKIKKFFYFCIVFCCVVFNCFSSLQEENFQSFKIEAKKETKIKKNEKFLVCATVIFGGALAIDIFFNKLLYNYVSKLFINNIKLKTYLTYAVSGCIALGVVNYVLSKILDEDIKGFCFSEVNEQLLKRQAICKSFENILQEKLNVEQSNIDDEVFKISESNIAEFKIDEFKIDELNNKIKTLAKKLYDNKNVQHDLNEKEKTQLVELFLEMQNYIKVSNENSQNLELDLLKNFFYLTAKYIPIFAESGVVESKQFNEQPKKEAPNYKLNDFIEIFKEVYLKIMQRDPNFNMGRIYEDNKNISYRNLFEGKNIYLEEKYNSRLAMDLCNAFEYLKEYCPAQQHIKLDLSIFNLEEINIDFKQIIAPLNNIEKQQNQQELIKENQQIAPQINNIEEKQNQQELIKKHLKNILSNLNKYKYDKYKYESSKSEELAKFDAIFEEKIGVIKKIIEQGSIQKDRDYLEELFAKAIFGQYTFEFKY